jgi:hypothetical protein
MHRSVLLIFQLLGSGKELTIFPDCRKPPVICTYTSSRLLLLAHWPGSPILERRTMMRIRREHFVIDRLKVEELIEQAEEDDEGDVPLDDGNEQDLTLHPQHLRTSPRQESWQLGKTRTHRRLVAYVAPVRRTSILHELFTAESFANADFESLTGTPPPRRAFTA